MEILFLALLAAFVALSYFLSKKKGTNSIRYVYGNILYERLPEVLKKRLIGEEELEILSELSTPYNYEESVDKYTSQKLGLMMLILIFGLILSVLFSGDYIGQKEIENTIKKPEYKTGTRKEKLRYKIAGDEGYQYGFLDIDLEELMTEDEVAELLEMRYEELLENILGENKSSLVVSENLVLKDKPFKENILVKYHSLDENIINNSGEIVRENTLVDVEYPVTFKITLEYRDQVLPVSIDLIVKRKAMSLDEESMLLQDRIKDEKDELILPNTPLENEGEITWYSSSKGLSFYQIMASFCLVALGAFYLYKKTLIEKREKQRRSILLDLPDLINKLTLLIKAGFTPQRAWLIICDDYEKSRKSKRPLFEAMLVARNDILKGISFEDMLLSLARSCGNYQLLSMCSVLSQNMKRGSTMLIMALEQMGKEAWDIRVHEAKMLGEKASTMLLLPLGISFLVVILVIMAPLMISMSI